MPKLNGGKPKGKKGGGVLRMTGSEGVGGVGQGILRLFVFSCFFHGCHLALFLTCNYSACWYIDS